MRVRPVRAGFGFLATAPCVNKSCSQERWARTSVFVGAPSEPSTQLSADGGTAMNCVAAEASDALFAIVCEAWSRRPRRVSARCTRLATALDNAAGRCCTQRATIERRERAADDGVQCDITRDGLCPRKVPQPMCKRTTAHHRCSRARPHRGGHRPGIFWCENVFTADRAQNQGSQGRPAGAPRRC